MGLQSGMGLKTVPYVAPLCPAGHLPHTGGDQPSRGPSPIANVAAGVPAAKLTISPLVGEMSGRTEGGNVGRNRDQQLRQTAGCFRL